MDALFGVRDTLTEFAGGFKVTPALADFVGSARAVEVTVMVWALDIEGGAV